MVSKRLLAEGSLVLTPLGYRFVCDLAIGDRVLLIDQAGSFTESSVTDKESGGSCACVQLLTHVGCVLVPRRNQISCTAGLVLVDEIAEGGPLRLEAISPEDVPQLEKPVPLDRLLPLSVAIPSRPETALVVEQRLAAARTRASVKYTIRACGRWLVVEIQSISERRRWKWADELSLLTGLCVWDVADERVIARTRDDQGQLLWRLVTSYLGTSQLFRLDWLPGYLPVECRISAITEPWPAYAPVQRVTPIKCQSCSISTEDRGDLVIGSAIVRCTSR